MSRTAVEYEGVLETRLIKGGERFQLTLQKRIWQPRSTFTLFCNDRIGRSKSVFVISPCPTGAEAVSVVDVRVRLVVDKTMTVADMVEDIEQTWYFGPAINKVKALGTNEAVGITDEAAARRQGATETAQAEQEAKAFAFFKQLKVGGTFLTITAIAVALVVFSPQIKGVLPFGK